MKINIKVVPNSKTEEIIQGNPLVVRVKENAEKNKANIAVIKLLSKRFKSDVKIISGKTSKRKIIEIEKRI